METTSWMENKTIDYMEAIESQKKPLRKFKDEGDGFTVFKNYNHELTEKIRAVKLDDESFTYHDGKCYIHSVVGDQYLCVDKKKKFFTIEKSYYEERRQRDLLNKINNLYPVHEYFNQYFGRYFGNSCIVVSGNSEGEYDDMGKVFYSRSEINFGTDGDIYLNSGYSPGHSIMFCYFDLDGNYVNRDYNIDLTRLFNTKTTPKVKYINKITKAIPRRTYFRSENTWFTDEFAFRLDKCNSNGATEFLLKKELVRKDGRYGNRGTTPFKMPKDAVKVDWKDILEAILPLVEEFGFKF